MAPNPNDRPVYVELETNKQIDFDDIFNEISESNSKNSNNYNNIEIDPASIYNPLVDPCHPKYDASKVDTSKIIPNYGSKFQHAIYSIVSWFLNWLPFIIVMDCVIGIFWYPNDRYYTNQWGILQVIWLNQPSFYLEILCYYLILVGILSLILKHMTSKFKFTDKFLYEKCQINNNNNNNNTNQILNQINKLYPTTTSVICATAAMSNNSNQADILIIGTSHLSESSGQQVRQLIDLLDNKVKSVVLELDESRYLRMRQGDKDSSLYQATLARDLFRISTYLDPITLFARIGTNLTSYFVEPGMEFRHAANIAIEKNINIVYGDQELEKTVASIGKNTPMWLVIILNIFIALSYGFPIISAFAHLGFVFMYDNWINFATKIFVSAIVWNAIYYPIFLLIRVFTEQSKSGNGMKRITTLLNCLSRVLPCLAKVFKKSDFKTVRDETLAIRTLNNAKQYNNQDIVVAVVGLAHMNDMADIINNKML